MTKGKSSLEKALKLAKKLKKETTTVTEFLDSVNKDLDAKEALPGVQNLDQDLSYVKVPHKSKSGGKLVCEEISQSVRK